MADLIKIVEKHYDSLRTEYRGEYGYFWLTSHAFDGQVASFQDALSLLAQRFPDTFLAPRYVDLAHHVFIIQVVGKDANASDLGTYQISADGQVAKWANKNQR